MKIKLSSCEKVNGVSKRNSKNERKRRKTSPVDFGKKQLLLDNKKEDAILSKLTKNLKLKQTAVLSKPFCEDGLDYLLEACDKVFIKSHGLKNNSNNAKKNGKIFRSSEISDNVSKEGVVGGETVGCTAWPLEDFNKLKVVESCDGMLESEMAQETVDLQENICLEKPELEDCCIENQIYLKKHIKGLLNRLTEANMCKIAMQLEALYLSHSRNSVNKILVENIMISIGSSVRTPERLIQESAMLIAILQANTDTSVGVIVVHAVLNEFHTSYLHSNGDESKKVDNLIITIAHLHNFKVIDDNLVYDVLNLLTERFSDKDIELILSMLRTVGISLRKNNSTQLKELIVKLQKKANQVKDVEISCRVKFMLEVVLAIKNNNIERIPNYDPDHIQHLKKLMKAFIPKGRSMSKINMSLKEIIKGEENGHLNGHSFEDPSQSSPEISNGCQSEALFCLAKKHRMNTDVRRQIFTILITAEDYLEAYEKILQLHFKDQQDDEVMNLIVHCALQGKTYNPFYHLLACKLCSFNRKYLLSLQCSVWNKLEDINSLKKEHASNLANFVSNCIIEKGLPLTALRVVDLSTMNQSTTTFLKEVMLTIFRNSSCDAFEDLCKRSTSAKHAVFRESIWLYVKHILCSTDLPITSDYNCLMQKLEIMHNLFCL